MKIAFLSCIHGNYEALTSVDQHMKSEGVDKIYCLGDIVGYGTQPKECLNFVRERGWPTIKGNHEQSLVDANPGEGYNEAAKKALWFSLGALNKADRDWIRSLPRSLTEDAFQVVHGSTAGKNPTLQYIMTEDDAKAAFEAGKRTWIFHGHTHCPIAYFESDPISYDRGPVWKLEEKVKALLNVGSVGQPRDGDPRACYGLFDTEAQEVTLHRVEYDVEVTSAKILEAGLDPRLAKRLLLGR